MKYVSLVIFVMTALSAPLFLNGQTKIINTIAGNHTAGYTGDGGPAMAAEFDYPIGIALDASGNIYVADLNNNAVRKINPAGIVTTLLSGLHSPTGVAVDASGNVYISDGGTDRILKWSSGTVTTVAGGVGGGYTGDGGPATLAGINYPSGIAVDASGNLYITDAFNSAIRKVTAATGIITTIAGTGVNGYYLGEGGPATAAQLYWPQGSVTVDAAGNVYLPDGMNHIRKVTAATGIITTVAGTGLSGGLADGGPATNASIQSASGIAVDASGNVYITDDNHSRIRKVDLSGMITTFAGNSQDTTYSGYSTSYTGDGGPPDSAGLSFPTAAIFDADGNLLFTESGNNVIRRITGPNGIFFTGGLTQNLSVCENAITSINSVLAVTDTTPGETVTWSVVAVPKHGVLVASYTAVSVGGVLTPVGLTYTPTTYYTGKDSFVVKATNGNVTAYTTIQVTLKKAPIMSITPLYTTICNGSSTYFRVGGTGTPGGGTTVMKQDFNTSIAPWTVDNTGATGGLLYPDAAWHDVADGSTNFFPVYHSPDSTSFALVMGFTSAPTAVTKSKLISPSFSLVGYADAALHFDQYYYDSHDTAAKVEASKDGGITWNTLIDYAVIAGVYGSFGYFNSFVPETLSLSAYAGYPNVQVRFNYNGKQSYVWAIDNVKVIGYPTGTNAATWSPATNLYTNTGLTNAYITGDYRDTVYVHPTTVTTPTNFTYYATESIGTCFVTDSVTITVNPAPQIMGSNAVCVGSYDTLTDATPYGLWSASNSHGYIGATAGIFNGLTVGADTIMYTVSSGSCAGTSIFTVTVSATAPVAGTITGASIVCAGAAITLSDAITGGIWSSTTTAVATAGSTGVITGITGGSATISYTVTNGCGSAATAVTVAVGPAPVAGTITGLSAICAGATTGLSDAAAGGAWSSSATGIATVSGAGIVTGLSGGTATISYTVTNSCGTAAAMATITINPLPVSGAISGPSSVCVGATASLTDPAGGGVWSSSATGIATVSSTGLVTGIAAGTTVISYLVANSCGSALTTKTITVAALPFAGTISGISTVCAGATTSLTDPAPGGVWGSSATGIATVSGTGLVTGIAGGTSVISYLVTNSCGAATATKTATVAPLPISGTISGISTVCVGVTTSLTDAAGGGAWSSSATGIATVSGTGLVTGIVAGTSVISYLVTNSCGSATATKTVTVTPLPFAGTISGISAVCVGATISLTDPSGGGVWSSSATSIATVSGAGLVAGIATGTSVISYLVTNSCGSVATVVIVNVNPLPVAGAIVGVATVCVGSSVSLTDVVAGGVWSSSVTAIASAGSTGAVVGIAAGSAIISYSITNSCGIAVAVMPVIVNPLPDAGVITGGTGLCIGATMLLSDLAGGGIWGSSNTKAAISGGGMVTGILAGADTISYTVVNSCGTASAVHTIQVNNCHLSVDHIPGAISGINIFPNPTSSILNIGWTTLRTGRADIVLTDYVGRVVLRDELIDNGTNAKQLNLSNLMEGIYLLKITSGSDYYTYKIAISK